MQRPVAFAVVPVWIKNGEKIIQTCAFLDSGSDTSLIVDDLADELGLEGKPKMVSLKTLSNESSLISKEVDVELHSIDFSSSVKVLKVLTVKKLPEVYRTVTTVHQMVSWSHLKDTSFPRVEDENVKLLIGCNAPGVHEIKEKRMGKSNEPYAIKTALGWTLFGPYSETTSNVSIINHLSSKDGPETCKVKVHLSGAISSPSCATFALQRTILGKEARFPECIIQTAKEKFYVDDLLTSVHTLEDPKLVYSQLKEMLHLGSFNLTTWASNNVELIKFISEGDHIDRNVDICLSVEENERILGKEWNVRTDKIFRMCKLDVTPARKTILSYVASIFDPDGFIAPIVLPDKLISQDACRLNLPCNEELPRECFIGWNCMLRGMKRLSKLLLPRCLVLGLYKPLPTQIYRFFDATEFAYGVVAYARFKDVSRQVHRSFLLAKSRVAKPKIKAPCDHNPKTTLRKPKKKKVTKPKMKTPKKPKVTLTKKSVNKTVKKQTAHIRRGIVHGVGKDAVVRVVNKSKDGSDKFKKANANRRQIMCSWNQNKIANALLERGCEWRFKLPRASHRGSVWGRIIKSIRRILQSLLFQKVLTDESLEMFLIEIKGIMNNRPFVKLVNDCDDLDILTPNKLLLVYRGVSFDEAQMTKTCLYNERWKEAQKLANLFWNRWLREYLPTLQARSKWLDMKMNLQPGDLVLVNNIGSPRNLWPKAIVRRVNYGPNGRVRTVRLKRSAGIYGICLFGEADYIDATVMKPGRGVRLGGNVSYVHN
ncbi:unnamed protein product [Schistosoma rodhaini]|uniref:DUF5641 domain-containing protein n=1 Tax=Schistosoma rodhaini TaxID=6188 RepID=A0AA85FGS7_9TREM|nr:unnamed protein product [Schistosoma rodhaini]